MTSVDPTVLADLRGHVEAIEVAAGGRLAVAASLAGPVAALDPERPGPTRTVAVHEGGATHVRLSSDGETVASGGLDGSVAVTTVGGRELGRASGRGWCRALARTPDGDVVASLGRTVVRLAPDGTERLRGEPTGATVDALAPLADGTVALGTSGAVRFLGPDGAVGEGYGWSGAVLVLAASPDGTWLAGGNQDASVRVRRLVGPVDDLVMTGYAGKVERLAWDHRSRLLAVANIGEVTVWDFAGRGPKGALPRRLTGHRGRVTAVSPHPSRDDVLAAGDESGLMHIRHGETSVAVHDLGAAIGCLAWAPPASEEALLVGLGDGRVVRVPVPGAVRV